MLLMDEGYKTKGEVFTVPVLHKRITFLLGPHASPHFFKANDDEMSQKEVYEFNVPTFGPGVVFDVDHKTRAEQFRFFADALKSARLALYVPQFVSEARQYFASWGDEGVVDLKDALAELTVMTAARTLLGELVVVFCSFFFSLSLRALFRGREGEKKKSCGSKTHFFSSSSPSLLYAPPPNNNRP